MNAPSMTDICAACGHDLGTHVGLRRCAHAYGPELTCACLGFRLAKPDELTADANAQLLDRAARDPRPGASDAARAVTQLGDALAVAVRIARRFGVSPKATAVMLRAVFSRMRREDENKRRDARRKAGAQ